MSEKRHKAVRMTVAHINDTHSYFEPTSLQLHLTELDPIVEPYVSAGGFARVATRSKQLRAQAARDNRGFAFLHAGDCFQGTLYFSLFKGRANAAMLNALDLDAMALGNHELDLGNEPVADFAQRIQFPLLAGNWDLSNEAAHKRNKISSNQNVYAYHNEQQVARWVVQQVDGEPVAIFGLSLDKMTDIANPDPDTPFINSLDVALRTVKAIRASGVNKIILLSHLGYEQDKALAEQVEGIGLIVGGHSHRLQGDFSSLGFAADESYGQLVNGCYVVQAGYHALSIGHCHIDFDRDGKVVRFEGQNELLFGRRVFLDASLNQPRSDAQYQAACEWIRQHPNVVVCKKDPEVQGLLRDNYMPCVKQLAEQVVTVLERPLRHVRIPDEQGASEVAPLVTDSFLFAMRNRGHDIQFALHNAGGVRNSLHAGEISVADIAGKLLPFAVPIGVYRLSGEALRLTLEGAINNALNNGVEGTGSGSYPYTSRLRFDYQPDNPPGERIEHLQVCDDQGLWQDVDPEAIYCGTSSAYTMKGKEGYDAILNQLPGSIVTTVSMADCFVEYLQARPESQAISQKAVI
ncbi:bifunctional metallophosphatase/5'-nucleotidase [Vibrio sp. WXL210]|uniref:bifunctional metallophosphatase/5'-nucleotidase n=1 Tax=Vibrio sp. WXL210 TaxID=3450709 RepID=UPI003EC6070F